MALDQKGVPYREGLVAKCEADSSVAAQAATAQLLECHRPTAIFAANDRLAYGAMTAIQAAGLRIPDDISVIGVGDYEQSQHTHPLLTTIAFDKTTLAQKAMALLTRSGSATAETGQVHHIPFEVVERQSCRALEQSVETAALLLK